MTQTYVADLMVVVYLFNNIISLAFDCQSIERNCKKQVIFNFFFIFFFHTFVTELFQPLLN